MTYLMVTTIVSDQVISESTPSTRSCVAEAAPSKHCLTV